MIVVPLRTTSTNHFLVVSTLFLSLKSLFCSDVRNLGFGQFGRQEETERLRPFAGEFLAVLASPFRSKIIPSLPQGFFQRTSWSPLGLKPLQSWRAVPGSREFTKKNMGKELLQSLID